MITIRAFKSKYDNEGANFERTWEHIVAKLNKHLVVANKADAPLYSPTIYIDNVDGCAKVREFKNKKGKTFIEWMDTNGMERITDEMEKVVRANKNVAGISMLVFDFDSGNADPNSIAKNWEGFNYIIHSTWSHTREKGKYRLVVPLKRVIGQSDFPNIWEDVSKIAGDIDQSCKDPSRMFYWPSCKPENEGIHYFHAVSGSKFFSPKIKKAPKPKKKKRGDYKTLDIVKYFASNDMYIGPANKSHQHWVKCPWESEHSGETNTEDTVVWETEGDNWPTFSCSHSTCRSNERNIVQVVKQLGDAAEFCKLELKKINIKTKTRIKSLGRDDGGNYYYQSGTNNHVVMLKPKDHNELSFYDITPDNDFWYKHFGKEESGKIDWKEAARALMESCQNAGFFKPISVRGAGIWKDEKRFVAHMGDCLRVGGENIQLTEFKSDYIYESAVQSVPLVDPLEKSEAYKLCDIINKLPIPDNIEKFLLSGHCVASIMGGCLRWRPHVWITGDSGSGKTTIVNDVLNALWAPIGGVFMEGRTTEAGVRQKVKHNAIPIIIDEVEANTRGEAERVDALVSMARSSSSNSAGNVAKGTISGHGLQFLIKTCFTFSSVAEALNFGQDKERFLVVHVKASKLSRNKWPELRTMIEDTMTKDFSLGFFARVMELSQVIDENCKIFHKAILKRYEKSDSRNADQVSSHAACAWALRSDDILTVEKAIHVLESIGDDGAWSKYWSGDETNTALNTLDKILSTILRGDSGKSYSVAELVGAIKDPSLTFSDAGKDENKNLQRYGMAVHDDYFWVSKKNDEFKKLFSSAGNIIGYLSNHIDVKTSHKNFMGLNQECIGLPLDIIFRKRG